MISELVQSLISLLANDTSIKQYVNVSDITTIYPNKPINKPAIVCQFKSLMSLSDRVSQTGNVHFTVITSDSLLLTLHIADMVISAVSNVTVASTEYCYIYGSKVISVETGFDAVLHFWTCTIEVSFNFNSSYINGLHDRVIGDKGAIYVGMNEVKAEPSYKLADFYGSLVLEISYKAISSSALSRANGSVAFSFLMASITVNDVIFNRDIFYKVWSVDGYQGQLSDGITTATINSISTINAPAYRYFLYQTISSASGKKLEILAPNAYIPSIRVPIVRDMAASYSITFQLLSSPTGELIRFAEEN